MTTVEEAKITYSCLKDAYNKWQAAKKESKVHWRKVKEKWKAKWFAYLAVALVIGHILGYAFPYKVEKKELEYYDAPGKKISTYICYVTDYGECYHAKGCGSLYKSSYKTTVYEATEDGYRKCSKCTPTQKTTVQLTETKSRYVKKYEYRPGVIEFFAITLVLYLLIILIIWEPKALNAFNCKLDYEAMEERWYRIGSHIRDIALKDIKGDTQ